MSDTDLAAIWTVLQTEVTGSGIEASPTGVSVQAGKVLAGLDYEHRRHVLIPLRSGEAFEEDLRGKSVHLLRLNHQGKSYLSAVCLRPDLNGVFTQFVEELLAEVAASSSPARSVVTGLDRWRELFSDAGNAGILTEPKLLGLLAELLTLEQLLLLDPSRSLTPWMGPLGHPQDFRTPTHALEIKATSLREGRIVSISSIDQLVVPTGADLHLAHYRFDASPNGMAAPDVIERILGLGVNGKSLHQLLREVGYHFNQTEHYAELRFDLLDRRVYDVTGDSFPSLSPASFAQGVMPPGILRLSYSIDLTNEPPTPLTEPEVANLLSRMANDKA